MKLQLVRCPRCGSTFYEKVEGTGGQNVNCPYCRAFFYTQYDPSWMREVDYYWEIYSGLYPEVKEKQGNRKWVKLTGVFLSLSVPFIVLPFIYLLNPDFLVATAGWERSLMLGSLLATTVFLIFVSLGIYNSFKARSFALTLSGTIFSIVATGLSGALITIDAFNDTLLGRGCFLMIIPLVLSLIALLLCIKNRKLFNIGY